MNGFLLDTNVLSEIRRPRPSPNMLAFLASKPIEMLFLSEVTFAEIRFGIEVVADAVRRRELADWLEHRVRPDFEHRALPVTENIMVCWRLLVEGAFAGMTT